MAKAIFMAWVMVILKPCNEDLASLDCISVSYSTKAMSLRPGTSLTSLNPENLERRVGGREGGMGERREMEEGRETGRKREEGRKGRRERGGGGVQIVHATGDSV